MESIAPKSLTSLSIITEFIQDLLEEPLLSAEISSWGCFSERFENKVVKLRSKDKKLADKTARIQIYAEIKPYLTDILDKYLRVRTSKIKSKTIIDQSYENEITSTIANTSANDPLDDNFSDISDVTDYSKEDEEGINDSIEEDSKKPPGSGGI
ncbi:9244_t:CDS:2 [Funneliformis geosporum]|uniref:9244_t:CDS:1 n=1 Tax=Funneliformis geosporum TaxID=1117311 RepID=A0A9W4WQW7_9GLOM|nr:9244_t:CDS:2 [Funneliformis geosporum]